MINEKKKMLSKPSINAGGILTVVISFASYFALAFLFFSIKALRKNSPAALTKKVTSKTAIATQTLIFDDF